jgi:hypothetical protein
MAIIREKPVRKTVIKGDRTINLDTYDTIVVSDEFYSTNGESLIIVRDVDSCTIKLDSITTPDKIVIKTLTNCLILPDVGRIDDDWDEISVGRGACVELKNVKGVWYILSSDGLKIE